MKTIASSGKDDTTRLKSKKEKIIASTKEDQIKEQ